MPLPYLQLSAKFITTQAPYIAALTRQRLTHVFGQGVALFGFAVEHTSTETKPPDGVLSDPEAVTVLEGVMGWEGEPGKLVDAFVRAGVLERLDVGLRVKGTDRYRRTWEKNNRRKTGEKPAPEVPVTGTSVAGTGAKPALPVPGDGDGDGEEASSPSEKRGGADAPAPSQPALVHVEPAKGKRQQPRASGEFHGWCMTDRGTRVPMDTPRDAPPSRAAWVSISTMLADFGRKAAELAWLAYAQDKGALERGLPFNLFASQWQRWLQEGKRTSTGPPQRPDVRKGVVRAEDMNHAPPGVVTDF